LQAIASSLPAFEGRSIGHHEIGNAAFPVRSALRGVGHRGDGARPIGAGMRWDDLAYLDKKKPA